MQKSRLLIILIIVLGMLGIALHIFLKAGGIGNSASTVNVAADLGLGKTGPVKDPPGNWNCTFRSACGIGGAAAGCAPNEKLVKGGCYLSYLRPVGPFTPPPLSSYPEGDGTRWYWRCSDPYSGEAGWSVCAYAECCL